MALLRRLLGILAVLLAFTTSVYGLESRLARRDDDLPARVPYVFPPPGTNAISDAIRARRANGTLLDLDGVLQVVLLLESSTNCRHAGLMLL